MPPNTSKPRATPLSTVLPKSTVPPIMPKKLPWLQPNRARPVTIIPSTSPTIKPTQSSLTSDVSEKTTDNVRGYSTSQPNDTEPDTFVHDDSASSYTESQSERSRSEISRSSGSAEMHREQPLQPRSLRSNRLVSLDGGHQVDESTIEARIPGHQDSDPAGTPQLISRVQVSPIQPLPGRNTLEHIGNRRISHAVQDLEEMVQEAVDMADGMHDQDRMQEICDIIEEAQNAVQDVTEHPLQSHPSLKSSVVNHSSEHEAERGRDFSTNSDPLLPGKSDYTESGSESPGISSSASSNSKSAEVRAYGNVLRIREQIYAHMLHFRRHHRRHQIARNWPKQKKRITAMIACINTALLGVLIGVYAGEVPRLQYVLADEGHMIIVGNAVLYFGLALSTLIGWSLPLLHGRKPYILTALALALPLQFPQAIVVSANRSPKETRYRVGLLCARAASGLVLGFANVNYFTVLLDLFGASLQSNNPHEEVVVSGDIRRHGGGMGIWLGLWSWSWIASIAIGFQIGAAIIEDMAPDWGFYIVVTILACALIVNIVTPETRYTPYRKAVTEVYDRDDNFSTRRFSRGEVKLHISTEGPKYWYEEVWAGIKLMVMMLLQPGFLILSCYLGWIYTQVVLVIILLGALLSREYRWQPRYVGAGVMSIAIGACIAVPLTKARIFSRQRKNPFKTDSMTFRKQPLWTSHLVRRISFMVTLPLMGIAYTVSSKGVPYPHMVPVVMAGGVGFFSVMAMAECHGLLMETFDTSDMQPGANTRHRLKSMAVQDRRRRTNYSSFPRVTAGIFVSQTIAFIGAGIATIVGGSLTRNLGAQASTGVTAGILLGLTVLLTLILWRFKHVQVIPNHTFGTRRDSHAWREFKILERAGRGEDWKPVVIGNPSGKMRKMSVLELGSLSRWSEIRKLNFLLKGPRLGEERRLSHKKGWYEVAGTREE